MAGGMMVSYQQAVRQPVRPVGNIDTSHAQQGHQGVTNRTTRAMARVAGGP